METFKLYVNGTYIGSGSKWKTLYEFDISSYAVPGLNVICVDAGTKNSKGFTAGIFLNETTGQTLNSESTLPNESVLDVNPADIKTFYINDNLSKTVLENVILKIEAIDNSTTLDNLKMRIRNEDHSWIDAESGWETFKMVKEWTLSVGSEEKTVFIEVIDEAKNITFAQDNITLVTGTNPGDDPESEVPDSDPGNGNEEIIIIITGLENDMSPKTEKIWNWDAGEIDQGLLFRYCIDQNPNGLPTGEYSKILTASVKDGSGDFYLHVQAKDTNGNLSAVTTVSTILDNVTPDIAVFKAGDPVDSENLLKVILSLTAADNITQTQDLKMRIRNENQTWQDAESGWETFNQTKEWTLSTGVW